MMRALLCVSDFPYTEPSVRFGGALAKALQHEVTLLSVRSLGETPKKGAEVLQRAAGLVDVECIESKTRRGSPRSEIISELESGDFDLLMIGARDHPSAGQLLLGFVARRLVKHVQASVLVIRQPALIIRHVLICTSGTAASEVTVRMGTELARAIGAAVTLLYVASNVPSMYAGLSRFGEGLPELLGTDTPVARHIKWCAQVMQSHEVDARIELRHGIPGEQILRAAEVDDYELIVIGGSTHRGINRILLDEVSLQIVTNSPRPVLVVRGDLD